MKIEPMSVDMAYCWIKQHEACFLPSCSTPDHQFALSAILAWIHAVARARMLEYIGRHSDCEDVCFFDESHITFDGGGELPYFIAAVKKEVGWPEDR